MKIKRFEQINENKKMSFSEAFDKFIKGKVVINDYDVSAYGDYNLGEDRHYGYGIIVEGNYKMISYGGGCSGENCNTTFIISPDDKVISKIDW